MAKPGREASRDGYRERERGMERKGRGEGVAATATQVCISKKIIIIDAAKEAHIQRGCAEEAREREREGDFKED